MVKQVRKISMKQRMAIANSWRTDEGTAFLCTGPITWSPMGAFDRLGEYGWDVARVNKEVTDALYKNFVSEVEELLGLVIDGLVEDAREEWEPKHADQSDQSADGGKPNELGDSDV